MQTPFDAERAGRGGLILFRLFRPQRRRFRRRRNRRRRRRERCGGTGKLCGRRRVSGTNGKYKSQVLLDRYCTVPIQKVMRSNLVHVYAEETCMSDLFLFQYVTVLVGLSYRLKWPVFSDIVGGFFLLVFLYYVPFFNSDTATV